MAIPISITITAITATRKDEGKQLAINKPIPNEISIIPNAQFLRCLTKSPLNVSYFYYIQHRNKCENR